MFLWYRRLTTPKRETGPNDKFNCPRCGGHYFSTTGAMKDEFDQRLGFCTSNKDSCGFEWIRANDYLYFTPGPTMKGSQF